MQAAHTDCWSLYWLTLFITTVYRAFCLVKSGFGVCYALFCAVVMDSRATAGTACLSKQEMCWSKRLLAAVHYLFAQTDKSVLPDAYTHKQLIASN